MASDPTPTGSLATADEFQGVTEQDTDRSRMSFLEHLDELRRRIIYSLYALLACSAVTLYFWNDMYRYLVLYFQRYGGTFIYTQPTAGFMFTLKIGFLAGFLIASPFIFSQLWLFVAPGLYAKEKRVVIPFVFFSTLLFLGGAVFGHTIAYPSMWRFLASFAMYGVQYMPSLDVTFSFYVKVILGLGLVFQMPMLVFFLARFGVVTAGFLLKKFRYAIVIIFVIAAVITPTPDWVTQLVFAAPMMVLYLVSIGVAWLFGKKQTAD